MALVLCDLTAATQQTSDMESWQYPYDVHHVNVLDSIDIAYVDEGSGPVVLFVHGLGSNLQAWKKTIDGLKAHHRCIAIDLPGYGKSSGGNLPYGMSFFADALIGVVEALELEEVSLVGHSMGGQVSMHVALRQHPSIKRLALMAPAGFEQFTSEERQWFSNFVQPEFIKATSEEQIIRNFELNFHEMPSLVVYGLDDDLIPNRILHPALTTTKVAESGIAALPKAELHLVASAGHFVQWEQSVEINKLLISFFRSGY